MTIILYELAPTRSARVRWTLLELGLDFETREGRELIHSDELRALHPMGKLPAIKDAGRPLFESVAICTWLADRHREQGLGWQAGTWERALHDQWCAFILSEVEAHLWSSARNTFIYPPEKRSAEANEQNTQELAQSLPVLDAHFKDHDWMVGDRFSVTDIIAGYATNWARRTGQTGGLQSLDAYTLRLLDMTHCPYSRE